MADLLTDALGVDRLPTELTAWLKTPERADSFATGIVERTRWLTLPPDQRADAAREYWFRLNPDDEALFRAQWVKLPADERAAIEGSWLDGLRSSIATEIYIAWAWHAEIGTPVRPTLLTATACALGLVNWTGDGRPFPVHACRSFLGLPGYDLLPAFIAAARLSTDPMLSDARIAELVGVAEASVCNWRDDFSPYVTAGVDLIFPIGLDAIPDDLAMTPDAIRAVSAVVAESMDSARIRRADSGERRRQRVEDLPMEPRATVFRAAVQIARNGWRVPNSFLAALTSVFGLTSAANSAPRPLIASNMVRSLGLPDDVDDVATFRKAARRDGKALHDHVAAIMPKADFGAFETSVDRLISMGWLTEPRKASLSVNAMAVECGVARDTVRRWRAMDEYRRLVRTAALMPAYATDFWQRRKA